MSRPLAAGHKAEVALLAGNAQAYLVEFSAGASTFNWSTFGTISYASKSWSPRAITFSGLGSNGEIVGGVGMRIEDIDGGISTIAQLEDGDLLVKVYTIHKTALAVVHGVQVAELLADTPAWDRSVGFIDFTLRDPAPLELPGLTMGVATGLGELVREGTKVSFGNETLVLSTRSAR